MGTYYYSEYESKQAINLKEHEKTVSSLRIPVSLKETFESGIKEHGNVAKLLAYLIRKYRYLFYLNKLPFSKKVKTEYQKRGTEIFTKSFRPELRDWLEIGMWASALNFSICKLFGILLLLEECEFTVNEKAFLYASYGFTTPYNFRIPQLHKVLRKGRSIFERGIKFYEPPD